MHVIILQRDSLKDLMKIELLLSMNYPHEKIIKVNGLRYHFLEFMMVMVEIGFLNF